MNHDSILDPELRAVVMQEAPAPDQRRHLADIYARWVYQLLKSAALMECRGGVPVHVRLKSGGKRASLN